MNLYSYWNGLVGERGLRKSSTLVLGAFFAFGSLGAQGQGNQSSGQIEEIIVTAEFREASVQETPIAITAITGSMLDNRAQTNLAEVTSQAPNVTLKRGGQARSGMIAFIRGVGQYDFIAALEPGVGVYVDDVYYAQLTGSLLELLDVDRLEILRGPQGTLAGRNSIGGAVKMYTKKPGEDQSGYMRVGFGNYNQVDFRGAGGMTLVEDKLFARVSAAAKTRDGYVTVLDYACSHPGSAVPTMHGGDGCDLGDQGSLQYGNGRLQLRWVPNDDLEISFAGDYLNDKSGIAAGVATYADRTAIEANLANPTVVVTNQDGVDTFYRDHIFVPYGPYHNANDPINDPYVTYATISDFGAGSDDCSTARSQDNCRRGLKAWSGACNEKASNEPGGRSSPPPLPSGAELAKVVIEMFGVQLARELAADAAKAGIVRPFAVDRPIHKLFDQVPALRALGLEVVLPLGDRTLVRRRRLRPGHVDQEKLHQRRRHRNLLRLQRTLADRCGEELVHVPEHLVHAHSAPASRRVWPDCVEARFDGTANGRIVEHRHGQLSGFGRSVIVPIGSMAVNEARTVNSIPCGGLYLR
jgi:hypothetical protein